ncbi:MAG TPA: acyltransferase [Myxococcota bacterium]|nr:acyltransferase [Myxococcota bacterium]
MQGSQTEKLSSARDAWLERAAEFARPSEPGSAGRRAWTGIAERGSLRALFLIQWIYRHLGRWAVTALLTPIVAYFFVTGGAARRASREYLRTLFATPLGRARLGRRPTWRQVYRHLYEFAENIADSMTVWSGDGDRIRIDERGNEHLLELVRKGRGGILLGAHLGSTDMLRVLSKQTGIVLNVLSFTRHAARINAFFDQLQPGLRMRLIHFEPGSISVALEIKAAIERGEFVGILGDRVWESERGRSVQVPFLGRRARFPLGPFLLQAALGCPMLLSTCVRTGHGRYAASTEVFAAAGVVPRCERAKYAEELAQRYAAALERECLRTPYQWFNFFEFWRDEVER